MEMDELFSLMVEEMPGYLAASVGSYGEGSGFFSHSTGTPDLGNKRDALVKMIRDYVEIYEGLGGVIDFGSNDEILITASRVYLLIKIDHNQQRFVAVLLSSNGNIGYLRFRIREYLKRVPHS
ncbi:MAG: hypothetical protein GY807_19840 [Gammaproteobacteria bacterium]|nr:hypothetical protein [Gammaproteobacteria bacterium]